MSNRNVNRSLSVFLLAIAVITGLWWRSYLAHAQGLAQPSRGVRGGAQ
jgi:hypothetical protein